MCGDLEDEGPSGAEQALYARFLVQSRSLLAQDERRRGKEPESATLHTYMDRLFADALRRAVKDNETLDDAKRYEQLSAQPLVFARLAGFLAAQLSLGEDPLRKVIEALMMGYAEAETIQPDHGHDHDHSHGHDHAHDDGHGHHHH